MFTRKHFRQYANLIAGIVDYQERCKRANEAADMFATSNSRFNRSMFLAACGVQ